MDGYPCPFRTLSSCADSRHPASLSDDKEDDVRRRSTAIAVALAVGLVGITALAAAATDDPTIKGCRHIKRGLIRVPREGGSCYRNETPLTWSVRGPQGVPGPAGPEGPQGPAGPPGGGLASLGGLVGLACTTYDGAAGRVDLDITPDDLVLVSCDAATPPPPPPGTPRLVINEVDYDQVGIDAGGFVEIANIGDSTATLDGVALVLVNGDGGVEYDRVSLTGTLVAGGYLKVDVEAQNGAPDGVALLDQAGTLLDALSYEGEITAATIGGQTYNLVEGTALPATVADSNTVNGSLSRLPNGTDTNNAATDWAFTTTPTPGAANVP
jgi:hypothetical protein